LTVSEFLATSTRTLRRSGIESPRLEAEILLSSVLGVERGRLVLEMSAELSETQLAEAERRIELRSSRRPIQYITEEVEFLGRNFSVLPGVFVPRPETEFVVTQAVERLKGFSRPRVLEPGTGSGVIAVSLAVLCEQALVYANDVSRTAVEVARRNAVAHGVSERVFLHVGHFFAAFAAERIGEGIDLLVSNPPYVPSAEIASLAPEIRLHEPATAIDGGADGLRCVRAVLKAGPALLASGGWLVLEVGIGQAERAGGAAASAGLRDIQMVKDLSGIERVLVARKP
jgi:release factor glutamine methyltransferase